jgi:hypothetical protein
LLRADDCLLKIARWYPESDAKSDPKSAIWLVPSASAPNPSHAAETHR